jgi:hypothetical protein
MNVEQFWDIFQEELIAEVNKRPGSYALNQEESPEQYARRTRLLMERNTETTSLRRCNLSSPTFKRVAKRIGIKFSQGRLLEAYAAMGGK